MHATTNDTPIDTFTELLVAQRDRDKAQAEVRALRSLLADAERDGRAWCEQLGVVQARCSQLIEEARAARKELGTKTGPDDGADLYRHAYHSALAREQRVRDALDIPREEATDDGAVRISRNRECECCTDAESKLCYSCAHIEREEEREAIAVWLRAEAQPYIDGVVLGDRLFHDPDHADSLIKLADRITAGDHTLAKSTPIDGLPINDTRSAERKSRWAEAEAEIRAGKYERPVTATSATGCGGGGAAGAWSPPHGSVAIIATYGAGAAGTAEAAAVVAKSAVDQQELALTRAEEAENVIRKIRKRVDSSLQFGSRTTLDQIIIVLDATPIATIGWEPPAKPVLDPLISDLILKSAALHDRQCRRIEALTSSLRHALYQEASTEDGLGTGWECAGCADEGFVVPVPDPEDIEHVPGCPLYEDANGVQSDTCNSRDRVRKEGST